MLSRRKFFTRAALTASGVAAFPHVARPVDAFSALPGQKPGRIIHLVADGMSFGTLTCADYLSQQTRKRGLTWLSLFNRPGSHRALVNMRSLNSMVTDSAAASSSWGSGSRVVNGTLNQLPSGRPLTPLCSLVAEQGWKRGLVTTTEITHATPAGFAASMHSRDDGSGVASQYLDRRIDVLLGGGRKFFEPDKRKDKRNLAADFSQADYRVLYAASDLSAAPLDRRWLGIFSESHHPYAIDWLVDEKLRAQVPSLPVMTRRALDWLGRHEHFLLQIEGGRVDQAAHNCDAPAAMREMLMLDEALDVVMDFQQQRPDTLVVITTDHSTGNMGLNGTGTRYAQSAPMFNKVADCKASFVEIMRRLRQRPAASVTLVQEDHDQQPATSGDYVPGVKEIQHVIGETTGYKVSDRRAGWFRAYLAKQGVSVYELMNSEMVQLGQLLANHFAVGWAGSVHTSDYVPLIAIGPGAERFEGFLQGTDIFRHYTHLAGIDFKNPEEPLMTAIGPEAGDVENLAEYALV